MNNRIISDITDFIFMSDKPQMSDIILIPGTAHAETTEKAAELYHLGFAPLVMPSGKFSYKLGRFAAEKVTNPRYQCQYATEFDYCKYILTANGVPEAAILCENRATNTVENAKFSAETLAALGISPTRAILCCQAFHARRAFMSYGCFFPNTELVVIPAATQGITASNWHESERGYKKVLGELAKCGSYFATEHARLRSASAKSKG